MKKIISLLMVIALVAVCFAGCAKNVTIDCTCDCNAQAGGGAKTAAYNTLKASGKSGVDCSKLPSSEEDIFNLYKEVANATKAAKDQTVKVTEEGLKIGIDTVSLDKTGEPLSNTMMSVVKKLMDSFAPAPAENEYHFVNGTDANGAKTGDGEARTTNNTLPVTGTDTMCSLEMKDVKSATIEELDDGYWKVVITINDAPLPLADSKNTPDTPHAHAMVTLKASDLIKDYGGQAQITKADLQFKDTIVQAVIDPASGYLVQLYTGLNVYGTVEGNISLMNIGGLHGTLAKTTAYTTYDWSAIG